MQPYFFPYLGYFVLINQVDLFVLLDTVQFMRHKWIERNQILKANGEPLYIKVPLVKHRRNTNIEDIFIRNKEPWRNKIFAQLKPYKKKSTQLLQSDRIA
ncbi:WbqC family protein [Flagellimonas marinaquae]